MAEYWDLFDENRVPTGKTVERGKHNGCGLWHVVVFVVIKNGKGEYCITRRDTRKECFGGLWEFPGGSVLAGETSEEGAIREIREETGIDHTNSKRTLITTVKKYWDDGELGFHGDFDDIWLFEADYPIEDIVLLDGETIDAKWVSEKELGDMAERGEFCDKRILGTVFDFKE